MIQVKKTIVNMIQVKERQFAIEIVGDSASRCVFIPGTSGLGAYTYISGQEKKNFCSETLESLKEMQRISNEKKISLDGAHVLYKFAHRFDCGDLSQHVDETQIYGQNEIFRQKTRS